jgi:hypothetical protein
VGRTKKNKPRGNQRVPRKLGKPPAAGTAAAQVRWTPLKQACGCVVDWGWSADTADPLTFRDWCVRRPTVPCPWHTTPEAGASGEDLPNELIVQLRGADVLLHVRKAPQARVALGLELTSRLEDVLDKASQGDSVLLDDAPAGFRSWYMINTPNPAEAWLDHVLNEIILNQGRAAVPAELVEKLFEQPLPPPTNPQPDSAACNICSFAAANGGMLCECGHDWTCHPGSPSQPEPCSHCACADMRHAA